MSDFFPPEYEDPHTHSGDPTPYGRSRKKEIPRYLAYLDAIKKKKPTLEKHSSTMLSEGAPSSGDPFKEVRKIMRESELELAKIKARKKSKKPQNKLKHVSKQLTKNKNKFRIYVIELDDPMTVYVGQSWHTPEIRFQKHRSGWRASRHVRKAKKPKLRPDLYKHLPAFDTREAAEFAESHHAGYLRKQGFKVFGGH